MHPDDQRIFEVWECELGYRVVFWMLEDNAITELMTRLESSWLAIEMRP